MTNSSNKKWVLWLVIALLLIAAVALAACGPKSTPTPTATVPAATEEPTEEPTVAPTATNAPPTVRIEPVVEIEGVVDADGNVLRSPALANVGVGAHLFLEGFASDPNADDTIASMTWALTAPDGSAAALTEEGDYAYFVADVIGQYEVTLTAVDSNGNETVATLPVNAGAYVGVGIIDGATAAPPQCAACHEDRAESWAGTGHATFFTRQIDGGDDPATSHYSEACIGCHTVGYDTTAANGGFDDVATEVGWTFPETLAPGNWDAVPAELKQLANIQCEDCHGPGSEHNGNTAGIAATLSAENCAFCHDEPPRHIHPAQWALSGHADATARAFTYPVGEGREDCVRCHSGAGFIDTVAGAEEVRTNFQPITCAVCHDPHDATNPAQLRVVDNVTLPDGTEVTDAGPSATCMSCHNGRVTLDLTAEEVEYPHHSTAGEMVAGAGGYTFGETLDNSPHTAAGVGCVDCHMAATPGFADEAGTEPLPGHDAVGAHTFKVTSADGVENIGACAACHDDVTEFNRTAAADYDGDGTVEGVQDEVQGLLDVLVVSLEDSGVVQLESRPYWENVTTDGQKAATYNWLFVTNDRSMGIHNTARTVELLQLSYKNLTGEDVPGATIR